MHLFKAWVDECGGNADRQPRLPTDARLVDVETSSRRILVRFIWRRRPLFLTLQVWPTGRRGRTVFRIGRYGGCL